MRQNIIKYATRYLSRCDGSGIRLGQSVGGATKHMDRVTAWRFLNPPMSFKGYCGE